MLADKKEIKNKKTNASDEEKIYFISSSKHFHEFSNFYERDFTIGEITYKTNEHYFQSKKFSQADFEYALQIINAQTPKQAKSLGRRNPSKLRQDWNTVRIDIMYEGLEAKFSQNDDLKQLLLSTRNKELIENNKGDAYWGCGRNGKGMNMQGKLLMKLRDEFS
jgi:ribA/ribD-fused uncharacterized protein